MPIKVLFFASLRERLKRASYQLPTDTALKVTEVWQRSTNEASIPANILISVNQEYVQADALVKPGDEVAFFPPVTGG